MKKFRRLVWCLFATGGCSGGALPPTDVLPAADPRLGGDATALDATSNAYSNSIDHLDDTQAGEFSYGHSVFSQNWVTAPATTSGMDGLGPLYNAHACSSCHSRDGRSAPADENGVFVGMLLRLSIPGVAANGGPNPDPVYGDQLRPYGIVGVPGDGTPHVEYRETPGAYGDGTAFSLDTPTYTITDWGYGPPANGTMISPRTGPSVIGLGLLEAVPEAEILANVHDADDNGVHGVPNHVWDAAQQATVLGRLVGRPLSPPRCNRPRVLFSATSASRRRCSRMARARRPW